MAPTSCRDRRAWSSPTRPVVNATSRGRMRPRRDRSARGRRASARDEPQAEVVLSNPAQQKRRQPQSDDCDDDGVGGSRRDAAEQTASAACCHGRHRIVLPGVTGRVDGSVERAGQGPEEDAELRVEDRTGQASAMTDDWNMSTTPARYRTSPSRVLETRTVGEGDSAGERRRTGSTSASRRRAASR